MEKPDGVSVASPTPTTAGVTDGVFTGTLVNEASFTLANGQTWSQNAAGARNNPGTNVQVAAVVSGGKLTSVSLIHPTASEGNANNTPYVLQCGPNFDTPCATLLEIGRAHV